MLLQERSQYFERAGTWIQLLENLKTQQKYKLDVIYISYTLAKYNYNCPRRHDNLDQILIKKY